jgi:parallel beta-helix repeat protein
MRELPELHFHLPMSPENRNNKPRTMPSQESSFSENGLELPAGYRLEDYRILDKLGQGGFGITYLAEDTRMQVRVAIKELFPDQFVTRGRGAMVVPRGESAKAEFAWAKARFIDEAAILVRLNHPNLVRVFRLFEMNNTAYIVMEFIQGQSFREWAQDRPAPAEDTLREVLFSLLDGLEYVHQRFIHRDISPENIRFSDDGRPLLMDFGNARALEVGAYTIVIKHGFSPIEQYQSEARQGPYTDIYALAGVMIYAITGRNPPHSIDRSRQRDPYQPLAQRYRGRYSDAFLKALDWGFAILPKDRPQTVACWRRKLATKPPPPPPPKPRVWPFILLSLVLISLLGAAAFWFLAPHSRRLTVPDDFLTIQGAINAAKASDTVYVKAGIYNEDLEFKDGITLEGEDPTTTFVRYSAPPVAVADQRYIDSPLEIRNCKSGTISNLSFFQDAQDQRVVVAGKTWKTDAITIFDSSGIVIKNCRARSLANCGIGIYKDSVVSLIENQCRSNQLNGICFASSSHGTVRDNICEENGRDGIDVLNAYADLENNRCTNNKEDGIYFWGGNSKASGNVCKENLNYGIQVNGATVELTENECSLNQFSGIFYRAQAAGKASENVCQQNAKYGIELNSASPSLVQNQLVKNSLFGIGYDAASNPTLTDNRFEGNVQGQLEHINPSPTPTPYHFPAQVRSPGPLDIATPTPARLVVPDQYKTIQSAINAAKAGDTVYVRPGTYNEAVKFKEGITLQGEDPDTTIVRYSTPATATGKTTHFDSPLEVRDCKTGTILNFTFHQDQTDLRTGDDVWTVDAVTIWQSSITIKNCRATSAAAAGIGAYSGSAPTLIGNQCRSNAWSGISFYGGSTGTAQDNFCAGNGLHGIYVTGAGTNPDLEKNVCESNDENGIEFSKGANGKANQNTCRQNKWNGISVDGDTAPSLTSNVLVRNGHYGIWGAAQARPVMLGNQFDNNSLGDLLLASTLSTPRPTSTPSPRPEPSPSQSPFTFGPLSGPLTLPSSIDFGTPTPTGGLSPKPSVSPWWRNLLSPSPTPASGLPKK